ncbi:MAG TPA: alkaline phosphatase PhoX, partial [Solirubrobacteraceae bacterium]
MRRREFLRDGAAAFGAVAMGPAFWQRALSGEPVTRAAAGPYGPLGAPNALGVAVPDGFSVSLLGQAGLPVAGTTYLWPTFPDGSASFALPDGGFVLAVNSEVPGGLGGASAVRFGRDAKVVSAYRILGGTSSNCAGGGTPWGTWLSCEETETGLVWECDPLGARHAVVRPALGRFQHEAAAVDPAGKRVYLTEDMGDGGLYRFTPDRYPDLGAGVLEIATDGGGGRVAWARVPDPGAASVPTRKQVPGALQFRRGEGIFYDSGIVYVATTSDDRIHGYDTVSERLEVVYDGKAGADAPLHRVDNLTAHPASGDLFVCEDADDLQICLITGERVVAPFAQLSGPLHRREGDLNSELTGVTFDPDGRHLFFTSQRGALLGMTFMVSGPFRTRDPRRPPLLPAAAPSPLALRAKPAARVASVRRDGLVVSVDA